MLYMIFQYDWEPVLIQQILTGFEAIHENIILNEIYLLNIFRCIRCSACWVLTWHTSPLLAGLSKSYFTCKSFYFLCFLSRSLIRYRQNLRTLNKYLERGYFFLGGGIYLGRMVVSSSNILILPRTYEKIYCKGRSFSTERHKNKDLLETAKINFTNYFIFMFQIDWSGRTAWVETGYWKYK